MNEVMKIKDLAPGEYTVTSYELKNGLYGNSYIVDLIDENNNESLQVWSTSYLANYISATKPRKKFKINIEQNKIKIDGYSRKVILQ